MDSFTLTLRSEEEFRRNSQKKRYFSFEGFRFSLSFQFLGHNQIRIERITSLRNQKKSSLSSNLVIICDCEFWNYNYKKSEFLRRSIQREGQYNYHRKSSHDHWEFTLPSCSNHCYNLSEVHLTISSVKNMVLKIFYMMIY
jgi:hypothetical protein